MSDAAVASDISSPPAEPVASVSGTAVFSLGVVLAAGWGWINRDEYWLSPETGLGYWLGILGGSAMLMLLLYPLRKYWPKMSRMGSIPNWFRMHMVLGVIGPLCIVFHCNFSLGAANSNISLLCMTLMVSSGLVGRYLYSKVHQGLYGQRRVLSDMINAGVEEDVQLRAELAGNNQAFCDALDGLAGILNELRRPQGFWGTLATTHRAKMQQRRLRAASGYGGITEGKPLLPPSIERYAKQLTATAQLRFFDELFRWWHTLHMPIFILLVITGLVHVWAVHNY